MAGAQACQNFQKERYAIDDDTTITPLHQPGFVEDPLTEIARDGARRMLAAALTEEDDEVGAPKRRPCLVLDTLTKGDERFVEIAYGTSADTRANRGYEVIVKQSAARATAGLSKPTRFVCARRIIVHVDNRGFDGRTKGPDVIGRLDAPLLERMNAVRARIQAEADIAAYYRDEQRREEQTREDRGFQ